MSDKVTTLDDKVDRENQPEEVYLVWESPGWVFKRRSKEFFTNVGAIVFFLLVIMVFAREFVLIATVLSIVFVVYVLSTVPPQMVKHRLTSRGIESANKFYRWDELTEFWFETRWEQKLLVIRPVNGTRILVLLGDQQEEKIKPIINKHLVYRETPDTTFVDRASSWLSEKIPLEKS